jgi:uncharacterized protein
MDDTPTYAAFLGDRLLARGPLRDVLSAVKKAVGDDPGAMPLFFEDASGRQVDFDLRGTLPDVLEREAPLPKRAGRGRPRMGVVSREVSLLPGHWRWLEQQPGSISSTLRHLVQQAKANETARDRARRAAATAGRAMTALAGDREHFEEAYRALDAGDRRRFEALTAGWPDDIRDYLAHLARDAFPAEARAG